MSRRDRSRPQSPSESIAGDRSSLRALIEVLDDAREGAPRSVTIEIDPRRGQEIVDRAHAEARGRGFVPIMTDVYLRSRHQRAEELQDRSLLLIASPESEPDSRHAALVDAAARSSRPHVLLVLLAGRAGYAPEHGGHAVLKEARTAYDVGRRPDLSHEETARQLQRAQRAEALARSGCHAAADRLLRDVRGALTRRAAWAAAADVGIMLGRLLLERGRAVDADTVFGEAAAHVEAARDRAPAFGARLWQAAARTDRGHLAAAESVCRAVLASRSLSEQDDRRARATLARVLLWQDRALEAADLGLMSDVIPAGAEPFVAAVSVRVCLETGDIFRAGQLSRDLLTQAGSSPDPVVRLIASTTHLRLLAVVGDRVLAEEQLTALARAAREARSPLRLARGRLLMLDLYRRCGVAAAVAREVSWLRRLRPAAPGLLRLAIDRRLRDEPVAERRRTRPQVPATASALVALARDEEDDQAAVSRVLRFTLDAVGGTRLDLCTADAGPVSTVLTVGSGLPTQLGGRVLEAGVVIGPEREDQGLALGVPMRLGSKLLAALVARWPADRPAPDHARDLLDLACSVAAARVEAMLSAAREEARASTAIPELVGGSTVIADLRKAVTRAAVAPFAVLVEGESGVGKELVARAIHQLGPRRERRFCDVNCAALPDDLLEAELFGHARGAFTGAVTDRAGLFEDADGGTLFLDEVADLSPRAQAKLLRVVQQQEVRRVGETFTRKVDVRLVSAANRDMREEASAGRFRQDLLYRLDVIRIRIPPLRERPDDVAPLAVHLWRAASARVASTAVLSHGVLAALARYSWPGNVRELHNVISALAVGAPARGVVRPNLLPAAITGVVAIQSPRLAEARAQFERRFIEVALARSGGSRTKAARELGLSRQGLLKILGRMRRG